MKSLLVIILLNGVFVASCWGQVTHISGSTKFKTKVTYGSDAKTAKIPAGYEVDIKDANSYFFTIKYSDGNGYVNRNHINYNAAELEELLKTKDGMVDVSGDRITHSTIDDKYKYEIDHIRYCAGKYRKEIRSGYAFSLVGIAAVASPTFINISNPDTEDTVKKVGYGVGVLGALLIIDSNKWMKRIYFGPEGIGIKYSF